MSSKSADVVIVGAGVIGLTTAYCLAKRGISVTILDQGQPGQEASWAGAGMLPPGNLQGAKAPVARLRAFSAARWKSLSRELLELTGLDNGFLESGGLEIGASADQTRLKQDEQGWRDEGVPVESLTQAELNRLEPALGPRVQGGYRLPTFCQVRNPRHMKALMSACEQRGVKIVPGAPVMQFDISSEGQRQILAVRTPTERVTAATYLITCGAWSAGLTGQLGINLPVRPIRGQIVLLAAWPQPFRHVINHGPRYLVPRTDGKILIGATEEDVGFEKRNTVDGVGGLLEFARSVVPALAQASVEQSWSGLRPGSPNGWPYLSRLPRYSNAYVAAGHFRNGLQQSPGTGELMAEFITTGNTSFSLDHFRVPD